MAGPGGVLTEAQRQLINDHVTVAPSAQAAAEDAHAIAVMTEWDEFKDHDFQAIYKSMMKPAFVFDGRNVLDIKKLSEIGFEIEGIGKC